MIREVQKVNVERLALGADARAREARDDEVVVEEPLEIRISGDTLAITMRTPGHDRELVLGFLHAEGIIRSAGDVSALAPCGRTGDEGRDNTIDVTAQYSDFSGENAPRVSVGAFALGKDGTLGTKGDGRFRKGEAISDDVISWR